MQLFLTISVPPLLAYICTMSSSCTYEEYEDEYEHDLLSGSLPNLSHHSCVCVCRRRLDCERNWPSFVASAPLRQQGVFFVRSI